MLVLWLAIAVAVGFAAGWYFSGRRSVEEAARFEGRLEELQGQLVRERRANAALKAGAANGRDAAGGENGGPLAAMPTSIVLAAPAAQPDDLTLIKGIGSALRGRLNGMGITTFRQIAELSPEEAERIDALLGIRGRIGRDDWIGQARRLANGRG